MCDSWPPNKKEMPLPLKRHCTILQLFLHCNNKETPAPLKSSRAEHASFLGVTHSFLNSKHKGVKRLGKTQTHSAHFPFHLGLLPYRGRNQIRAEWRRRDAGPTRMKLVWTGRSLILLLSPPQVQILFFFGLWLNIFHHLSALVSLCMSNALPAQRVI